MKICIFDEYIEDETKECLYDYVCTDCIVKHDIGELIHEILIEKEIHGDFC